MHLPSQIQRLRPWFGDQTIPSAKCEVYRLRCPNHTSVGRRFAHSSKPLSEHPLEAVSPMSPESDSWATIGRGVSGLVRPPESAHSSSIVAPLESNSNISSNSSSSSGSSSRRVSPKGESDSTRVTVGNAASMEAAGAVVPPDAEAHLQSVQASAATPSLLYLSPGIFTSLFCFCVYRLRQGSPSESSEE